VKRTMSQVGSSIFVGNSVAAEGILPRDLLNGGASLQKGEECPQRASRTSSVLLALGTQRSFLETGSAGSTPTQRPAALRQCANPGTPETTQPSVRWYRRNLSVPVSRRFFNAKGTSVVQRATSPHDEAMPRRRQAYRRRWRQARAVFVQVLHEGRRGCRHRSSRVKKEAHAV